MLRQHSEIQTFLSGCTDDDRHLMLSELMRGLEWDSNQLIPHFLFEAFCRKMTMCAVELMVMRRKTPFHAPELLLIKRPEDSKDVFRGQWHGPGSLFYGHESPESVLARIVRKELGGRTIWPPVNIGAFHSETPRGNVLAMLMVTSFPGEGELPPDSGWFYEGDLPEPLVVSHRQLIEAACDHWGRKFD